MIQTDYLKIKTDNICVPVMSESLSALISERIDAERYSSCDFIEIRIDYIKENIVDETKAVLEYLRGVMPEKMYIVTFRTYLEGGTGRFSYDTDEKDFVSKYEELLEDIVENVSCQYIDVEINRGRDILDNIGRKAHKKGIAVIGSYHNFDETPSAEVMTDIMSKINGSEADVIKMAVMPENNNDVHRLMKMTKQAVCLFDKPVITMSMGQLGVVSRIYGFLYGSKLTFGAVGKTSAPGQIDAGVLRKYMDKAMDMKLALIGFMGSGKSAVSRSISDVLSEPVVDTDDAIVEKEGRSITQIFAESGEEYFREIETKVLKETIEDERPLVISCGGGIIKNSANRDILKEYAVTCMLEATPETILSRVKNDTNRPLLKDRKTVEDISAMIEERRPLYNMTLDFSVNVDKKSISDITMEILDKMVQIEKKS